MAPSSPASSVDSLFDDEGDYAPAGGVVEELAEPTEPIPASRTPPPIPGLYVFPSLLPREIASAALRRISDADHFVGGARDQVMLFTAPLPAPSSLPAHVQHLDEALADLLASHLPPDIHGLAFTQPLARQAILNLYPPGAGISPHIDLPGRYADGIVGASLTGGCVLTLRRGEERYDVYLPPRSVYVFAGEARWDWNHGIPARDYDVVGGETAETLPRDVRVSVTLRWMKDGAGLLS